MLGSKLRIMLVPHEVTQLVPHEVTQFVPQLAMW